MGELLSLKIGNHPVRFTPEGKVFVIDVIKAFSDSNRPFSLWEKIITEHQEVHTYCEDYPFQNGESLPVTDAKGWEQILDLLSYYRQSQVLI
jgi:hypothetical protein